MKEFRTKISDNGRIIIPVVCRRQLHFTPGEDLIIRIDNDELRIYSIKHSLKKARQLVKQRAKNKDLVAQLKQLRKEDFNDE
jgi:AbrB family looped-hinge helix DNA binding protein